MARFTAHTGRSGTSVGAYSMGDDVEVLWRTVYFRAKILESSSYANTVSVLYCDSNQWEAGVNIKRVRLAKKKETFPPLNPVDFLRYLHITTQHRDFETQTSRKQNADKYRHPLKHIIGHEIQKKFGHHGAFYGVVQSYDKEFGYRVLYTDGDKEDINEADIFKVLRPTCSCSFLFHRGATSAIHPSNDLIGYKIRKQFGDHGIFQGTVTSYHPATGYRIRYTDGDVEDLDKDEVMDLMRSSCCCRYQVGDRVSVSWGGSFKAHIVGRTIKKRFGDHGVFEGTVKSFHRNTGYRVVYGDGDSEDLSRDEIADLLMQRENRSAAIIVHVGKGAKTFAVLYDGIVGRYEIDVPAARIVKMHNADRINTLTSDFFNHANACAKAMSRLSQKNESKLKSAPVSQTAFSRSDIFIVRSLAAFCAEYRSNCNMKGHFVLSDWSRAKDRMQEIKKCLSRFKYAKKCINCSVILVRESRKSCVYCNSIGNVYKNTCVQCHVMRTNEPNNHCVYCLRKGLMREKELIDSGSYSSSPPPSKGATSKISQQVSKRPERREIFCTMTWEEFVTEYRENGNMRGYYYVTDRPGHISIKMKSVVKCANCKVHVVREPLPSSTYCNYCCTVRRMRVISLPLHSYKLCKSCKFILLKDAAGSGDRCSHNCCRSRKRKTSVEQIDINSGNVIAVFPSMSEASRALLIDNAGISKVVNGLQGSCGGYFWRRITAKPTNATVTCRKRRQKEVKMPNTKKTKIKSVEQVDACGEVIATFLSVPHASKITSIHRECIYSTLRGGQKSAGGFFWRRVKIQTCPYDGCVQTFQTHANYVNHLITCPKVHVKDLSCGAESFPVTVYNRHQLDLKALLDNFQYATWYVAGDVKLAFCQKDHAVQETLATVTAASNVAIEPDTSGKRGRTLEDNCSKDVGEMTLEENSQLPTTHPSREIVDRNGLQVDRPATTVPVVTTVCNKPVGEGGSANIMVNRMSDNNAVDVKPHEKGTSLHKALEDDSCLTLPAYKLNGKVVCSTNTDEWRKNAVARTSSEDSTNKSYTKYNGVASTASAVCDQEDHVACDGKRCSDNYDREGNLKISKPMIFECTQCCCCSKTCNNRVVGSRRIRVPLQVFSTKHKGWGVRALDRIKAGSFVCQYIGKLISEATADEQIGKDKYILDLYTDSRDDLACINSHDVGNVSRFINHSCAPNLVKSLVYTGKHLVIAPRKNVEGANNSSRGHTKVVRFYQLAFFAVRDIEPLEELSWDYQYTSISGSNKQCHCQSANCRGLVF